MSGRETAVSVQVVKLAMWAPVACTMESPKEGEVRLLTLDREHAGAND